MNNNEREALQIGDRVGRYVQYSAALLSVSKRTATQITLSDGSRWILRSGRKVGASTWSYESLCTEKEAIERLAEIRAKKATREFAQRLERVRWRDMTPEQLSKITAVVDEIEKAAQPSATDSGTK